MRSALFPPSLLLLVAACSKAPPARSPLREQLAAADTPSIEAAARTCLRDGGWKVDDVGTIAAGGANVITAAKTKELVDVYVYPGDQYPRVTGGPDDDAFWVCLGRMLHSQAPDQGDKTDKADKPPTDDKPAPAPAHS
jgi:hypothetical protein